MIVCPDCGRQSADTAKFCDKCGKPLPASAAHVYDAAYEAPVKVTAEQHIRERHVQERRAEAEAEQARAYAAAAAAAADPRPEDMQLALRPQRSYKGALIAVSIIAAILVVCLAIALAVQSIRLAQATNCNEHVESYQQTNPSDNSGKGRPDSAFDNNGNGNGNGGINNGKNGIGSPETFDMTGSYQEVVTNLIATIKADAGTQAAAAIRESNGSLADINDDGEDELMLIYTPDGQTIVGGVYCYDDSGSLTSMTEELGTVDGTKFAGIYSGTLGNNAIVCLVSTSCEDDGMFACEGTMYTVRNGDIRQLHRFSCTEPADGETGGVYMIDGKKVTKSKFNDYLGALEDGECFFGTDTPGYSLISLKNLLK